ncbi:MAG: urease accessory protein UreF [Steroidobacteraceae bacterium]
MLDSSANSLAMLRLCQLVSPALPIGAYNFSQGLEYAAHMGWVQDEDSTFDWVCGVATHAVGTLDVPLLLRMYAAWSGNDADRARYWSSYLLASRETEELRAEERHLGRSLAKVLVSLQINAAAEWTRDVDASYACLFALAASHWHLTHTQAATAYVWAWCENQVLAAVKLLPLGQSAGQRILNDLLLKIPAIVDQALSLTDDDIGVATPLQGMASAWHETQYTRLFRS